MNVGRGVGGVTGFFSWVSITTVWCSHWSWGDSFSEKTTHHAERRGSDSSRGGVETGENASWVLSVGGHIRPHVTVEQICHLCWCGFCDYLLNNIRGHIRFFQMNDKGVFLVTRKRTQVELLAYDVALRREASVSATKCRRAKIHEKCISANISFH